MGDVRAILRFLVLHIRIYVLVILQYATTRPPEFDLTSGKMHWNDCNDLPIQNSDQVTFFSFCSLFFPFFKFAMKAGKKVNDRHEINNDD